MVPPQRITDRKVQNCKRIDNSVTDSLGSGRFKKASKMG